MSVLWLQIMLWPDIQFLDSFFTTNHRQTENNTEAETHLKTKRDKQPQMTDEC